MRTCCGISDARKRRTIMNRLPSQTGPSPAPPPTSPGDGNRAGLSGSWRWRFFPRVVGKIRIDLGLYNVLDCRSSKTVAEVVELVDALASGASGRKPVGVRVPPSALSTSAPRHRLLATTRRSLRPSSAHAETRRQRESLEP